ncbi:hypothetical protein [Actibacterium sp. 188UL27-1]|uniref:hypothetical protein n=1 Tax=Actibacterium sp. 188UL27-1 TaxID=2786961 RepID=UPI0019586ED5|nr:hypothetical protein [Actibacterium sp. 188UL27-1]MBM7067497.1 hypothetical protein [Actibacterium sp. 188UL27-1]
MSTRLFLPLICCVAWASSAVAEEPLSAIDWLSDIAATPPARPLPSATEAPVAQSAAIEQVTVQPLGAPSPDAVGLLPHAVTGLQADLWGTSNVVDLSRAINAVPADAIPPIGDLLEKILIAELDAPLGEGRPGQLFLTRVDALMARGAVEEATGLIERAGITDTDVFRRFFDLALLTGREDRGCTRLQATPGITPSLSVRIFCLARNGDWPAAAVTLRTAEALGQVSQAEIDLLTRFLDPELFEGEPPLPRPDRPSPLTFRMLEAIGEPLPLAGLPLAFSHGLMRPNTGWKTRIAAAERLAKSGALDPNALLGVYTERQAAASGGAWDRIDAVQTLDTAMKRGDRNAAADAMAPAWQMMKAADLAIPFAELYGAELAALIGADQPVAMRIGLLSIQSEEVALQAKSASAEDQFLIDIARGQPETALPGNPLSQAIVDGFATPSAALSSAQQARLDDGLVGETLVLALAEMPTDINGDLDNLVEGLSLLRQIGLEHVARQTALYLMLLG